MSSTEQLFHVVNKVGDIANSMQAKIRYFVFIGLIASSALAWKVFSIESAPWWNLLKCTVVLLPVLIWVTIWYVLSQLREAPELVVELMSDEGGDLANLNSFSLKEPDGLRGLVTTIRDFQSEDGLEVVFDTISGVTLMANPFFVLLAFLSMAVLSVLIMIAPFVLLF
jgi:hypothetical protein